MGRERSFADSPMIWFSVIASAKISMRHLLVFISALALQLFSLAHAQQARNLAYEDDFVWYVSSRLAGDLIHFQKRMAGSPQLDEGEWAEQRMQFEMLYHHLLVDCDGPLPSVANILSYGFEIEEPKASTLQYVGAMNSEFWPLIQSWNVKSTNKLLDMYASGKYGVFPSCIVAGYLRQNPPPREALK
jgi:hypothetical protein